MQPKIIKNLLITSLPGTGKTTLLKNVSELLLQFDFKIDGFITEDICPSNDAHSKEHRVGFKIVAFDGGEAVIADLQGERPAVGRYTLYSEDLIATGVMAIERGIEIADVIVIDEIGPMLIGVPEFMDAVERAFASDKLVIATISMAFDNPILQQIKAREDIRLMELTPSNRLKLIEELTYWISEVHNKSLDKKIDSV